MHLCPLYLQFRRAVGILFITSNTSSMDVQGISLSTTCILDVQGVSLSTTNSMDVQGTSFDHTTSSVAGCILVHRLQCVSNLFDLCVL